MSEQNTSPSASQANVFEQSIFITASATTVERCITDKATMDQWLNPALSCVAIGQWRTSVGSEFDFRLNLPVLPTAFRPGLKAVVAERRPGLIVWAFDGFFTGQDRWECLPESNGTTLLNRFEFTIPNPLVRFGFNRFAAPWTKQDMEDQLQRIKQIAER